MKKNKGIILCVVLLMVIVLGIIIALVIGNKRSIHIEDKKYATFMLDGKEYQSKILIEDGSVVSFPVDPQKDGYLFQYWEKDGKKYDENEKITTDVVFNAVFGEIVKVTFDKDNGEDKTVIEVIKGEKINQIDDPQKEDYDFDGWYLNDKEFSFEDVINESITLTAKWKKIKIVYGDVNEDEKINSLDSFLILNYMNNKKELSVQAMRNADVNGDEKINYEDVILILGNSVGYFKNTLPNSIIKDYVLYGDINKDGILTQDDYKMLNTYIKNNSDISKQGKKNADVNDDSKINDNDLKDLNARLNNKEYIVDNNVIRASLTPIKDYVMYGDVNDDGEVTARDSLALQKYLSDNEKLSEQGKRNADVNVDGKVNKVDSQLILQAISGWYDNILPSKPIKDYVLYGDVDEDGELILSDIMRLPAYLQGNRELTVQEKKNADVNNDGVLNYVDAVLISMIKYQMNKDTPLSSPVKDYVLYGDISDDGLLDNKDTDSLKKHLDGTLLITKEQAKKNADANGDGKIDNIDLNLLEKFLKENESNLNLAPYEPLN